MRKMMIALTAAALLAPAAASAQSAADGFSYKEPSGMFGEGHTLWQLYGFIHQDKERTARFNATRELSTGSIRQPTYAVEKSGNGVQRARRPGEPDPRRELR